MSLCWDFCLVLRRSAAESGRGDVPQHPGTAPGGMQTLARGLSSAPSFARIPAGPWVSALLGPLQRCAAPWHAPPTHNAAHTRCRVGLCVHCRTYTEGPSRTPPVPGPPREPEPFSTLPPAPKAPPVTAETFEIIEANKAFTKITACVLPRDTTRSRPSTPSNSPGPSHLCVIIPPRSPAPSSRASQVRPRRLHRQQEGG